MADKEKARILLIDFPTQYQLTSTFLRFQERYESPKFRNKVFDLETYMDWYASVKGNFSYTYDWAGFNVPSHIFRPFSGGHYDPLTRKEKALLSLLKRVKEPYYVIGTYGGDTEVLAHETMHGLYYGHPDYAAAVQSVIKQGCRANKKVAAAYRLFCKLLLKRGYCKEVFIDEFNAYATTGWLKETPQATAKTLKPLQVQLWLLAKERFGVDLSKPKNHAKMAQFVTRLQYSEFKARLR